MSSSSKAKESSSGADEEQQPHQGRAQEKAKDADDYVGGYTIANDLVVRDYVSNYYRPPMRAKGWDTFGPLGPYLVSADEVPDPYNLGLRAYVNGELRQEGSTRDMILKAPELIEFMSRFMTLEAGDVILTGTPKGVGFVKKPPLYLKNGDQVTVWVDGGIGSLVNDVVEEGKGGAATAGPLMEQFLRALLRR